MTFFFCILLVLMLTLASSENQALVLSTDNASFKAKNIRAGSPEIFMSMVVTYIRSELDVYERYKIRHVTVSDRTSLE